MCVDGHCEPRTVGGPRAATSITPRRSGSDAIDKHEIGRDWMTMLRIYTQTFESDRAELEPQHPGQFLDIRHDDFVADPWPHIDAVYGARGDQLTSEARAGMQAWLDGNPKGKHGKHEYTLAEYGISEDEVDELFASYSERYGL